jgi:hypothetical protein
VKIKAWGLLLAVPLFGGIIAYNLETGIAYGKGGPVYEAINPDAFWISVYGAGLFILITLFAFFMAQAGDGINDDD